MKKAQATTIVIIVLLVIISIVLIIIGFKVTGNTIKHEIYSVNIANIERVPYGLSTERCKGCLNGQEDCLDNLKIDFNINSNYDHTLSCRFYSEDSTGNKKVQPSKDSDSISAYVGYVGYNSITVFVSDLREGYKVKVCCWGYSTNGEKDNICSDEYPVGRTCDINFKDMYK